MKKIILTVLSLAAFLPVFAQMSKEDYLTRYNLLVNKLGPTGVGVETLINKWESEYPEDLPMLCAKFNYYFTKCQRSEVVKKDQKKFLGNAPVLELNDSTGTPVKYFEEIFFDEEMYTIAMQAMDKASKLEPNSLDYRLQKVTSQIAFEKESPDMATQTLTSLIDYNYATQRSWTYMGAPVEPDFFKSAILEYCFVLYAIGTPVSYESFKSVSEKMLSYEPKNTDFLNNIGSYHLVYKKDNKQALKYYSKVLKLDPNNYTAAKNCVLMARVDKNTKLEKKYLPVLIRSTQDEVEKDSAKTRLESLK